MKKSFYLLIIVYVVLLNSCLRCKASSLFGGDITVSRSVGEQWEASVNSCRNKLLKEHELRFIKWLTDSKNAIKSIMDLDKIQDFTAKKYLEQLLTPLTDIILGVEKNGYVRKWDGWRKKWDKEDKKLSSKLSDPYYTTMFLKVLSNEKILKEHRKLEAISKKGIQSTSDLFMYFYNIKINRWEENPNINYEVLKEELNK